MIQVKHLLEDKGDQVFSIQPEASVRDAIKSMAEHGIGALLVIADDQLVGVVTERDYARKVILQGRGSSETRVAEIMVSEPVSVRPDDSVDYCMAMCTDRRIRHLPVVADGRVVGLVSIGDLVKSVISQQAEQLRHLEQYIAG